MSIGPTSGLDGLGGLANSQSVQSALSNSTDSTSATAALGFNDISGLQKQYPDLYNAMVQSMAWNICSDQQKFNDWMLQKAKEVSRESRG